MNPAASPSLWPPTRYGGVFVRRCCCFVALRGVSVDRVFSYLWGSGSGLLVYAVKRPESRWNDFDADPSSAQQRPPATLATPKSCTSTRLLQTAYLFRIPSFRPYFSDVISLSPSLWHSGGNQRELARQKNAKKSNEHGKGKRGDDGLSAAARKQR